MENKITLSQTNTDARIVTNKDSIKIISLVGNPKMQQARAVIKIDFDAYEKLVALSQQSGATIQSIATACINFCVNNEKIILVEEQEEY